jgi:hypothetical protein
LLQQGVAALHACPYSAQTPPSLGAGGSPHLPLGAPGVMLQTSPVQQSPVAVHVPPEATHTMPPSGFGARQCRTPVASGTQGERPQHSAAVLHVCPAGRQHFASVPLKIPVLPSGQAPDPRQRGKPSVSYAQHCAFGLTAHSQSLSAFEQALAFPLSLQMPPGTWLPWFCAHTPMVALPDALTAAVHVTAGLVPLPPQHSWFVVQRLFRILQPSPGWQTLTPVNAHGPQLRLQQLPHPLQRTPS